MGYKSFATSRGEVLYRVELEEIQRVNVLILDCDGTLIDITNSYDQATIETVKILFKAFTGANLKDEDLRGYIFHIKKSGGFANHWDVSYAILIGLLSGLSESVLEKIVNALPESTEGIALQNLAYIAKGIRGIDVEKAKEGVKDIVDYVDERGLKSIDEAIDRLYKNRRKRELLLKIKAFINYPSEPKENILSHIFEELYYGEELFRKIYGLPSYLRIKRGFIQDERHIIRRDTVVFLKRRFKDKIGLVTGRRKFAAERLLKDLLNNFFNKRATIFLEDAIKEDGTIISKPNPYLLERALSPFKFEKALYIGDSMEDLLMVRNLRNEKVLFAGVYAFSPLPKECLRAFIEEGADIVLPTINEVKELLGV